MAEVMDQDFKDWIVNKLSESPEIIQSYLRVDPREAQKAIHAVLRDWAEQYCKENDGVHISVNLGSAPGEVFQAIRNRFTDDLAVTVQ